MEAVDVAQVLRPSMIPQPIQIVNVITSSTRQVRETATNRERAATPPIDGVTLRRMCMESGWRLSGRVQMLSEAMCIVAGFGQDWHVILQSMVMVKS